MPRWIQASLVVLALVAAAPPSPAVVLQTGDLLLVDKGLDQGPASQPARVIHIDPGTGEQTVVSQGGQLALPVAIAVEASGSILVSESGAAGVGAILRIDPASGAQQVVQGGFQGLLGLALDPVRGDILAGDTALGIVRVDPASGAITPFASGTLFQLPQAIALDAAGTPFVAAFSTQWRILRLDAVSGSPTPISTATTLPLALAAGAADLWVADAGDAAILRVDPVSGFTQTVSSGGDLIAPAGIAVEANGQLVVADFGDLATAAAVLRVDPSSGAQGVVSEAGFLNTPGGITVVPEPAAPLLAAATLAALLGLRRFRTQV